MKTPTRFTAVLDNGHRIRFYDVDEVRFKNRASRLFMYLARHNDDHIEFFQLPDGTYALPGFPEVTIERFYIDSLPFEDLES